MMGVRANVLVIVAFFLVAPVLAQEPAPSPQIDLLNEVPNRGEAFVRQLSGGVGADVTAVEQSTEHYGRLIDTGSPQALSLSDSITLALQNNTDLKIQRLGPLAAANQVRRARSVFDPAMFGDVLRNRAVAPATSTLTAGFASSLFTQQMNWDAGVRKMLSSGGQLGLSWQNQRLLTNPSIIATLVPQYTTTLGLSLNQPLLRDFGWRYALVFVEVAQTTEQAAYYQYQAAIATIIANVERAYWGVVLAIEEVQVQEQGLTLADEVLRQNESKVRVGTLPQTALLQAQSEVARRQAILIRARNLYDVARDNLRAVINYPQPGAGPLVMIEPSDKPTVVPYDVDYERSLKTALDQRPELAAARLDVHGKGLQRKAAENQLLPRLNFTGNIGLNGLSGTNAQAVNPLPPPATVPVNPALEGGYGRALELLHDGRYYNYAAGATVEIPLDNAQAKADYAAANINFEQGRLSLQKMEEGITLEIKQAVSNLRTDLKSIDATRIARELAEENVRNQQARYDVGLVTTKDLLDFQDQLTQARGAEVLALTTYNTDLAEMRRVEGSLLSARNVMIERVSPEAAPWWARF
ncbi:MAG: TolC family protein [Candidatus Binatia bacterium]